VQNYILRKFGMPLYSSERSEMMDFIYSQLLENQLDAESNEDFFDAVSDPSQSHLLIRSPADLQGMLPSVKSYTRLNKNMSTLSVSSLARNSKSHSNLNKHNGGGRPVFKRICLYLRKLLQLIFKSPFLSGGTLIFLMVTLAVRLWRNHNLH
jgi:hypothetical protein